MPDRQALLQVVIVPIVKNEGDKDKILGACQNLHTALQNAGLRSKLDDRLDRSPGFKFNDYEMRVREAQSALSGEAQSPARVAQPVARQPVVACCLSTYKCLSQSAADQPAAN